MIYAISFFSTLYYYSIEMSIVCKTKFVLLYKRYSLQLLYSAVFRSVRKEAGWGNTKNSPPERGAFFYAPYLTVLILTPGPIVEVTTQLFIY